MQSETEQTFVLSGLGNDHIKVIDGAGNYGPLEGPAGALIIKLHIVYPDVSKISGEDRAHLMEISQRLYQ